MKIDYKTGHIFLTTNKINGMLYVGQSSFSPEERPNYMGSGSKIEEAFKEFGKDNFSKEILRRDVDNQNFLNNLEIVYTLKYKSYLPEIGYNVTIGPPCGLFYGNMARLPYVRAKMSVAGKGKVKTEEWKNGMRGSNNKRFGKKYKWYNDGLINKMFEIGSEVTEGFKLGKIMRVNFKKENNPNWGNHWTQEQKEAQGNKIRGNKHTTETKQLLSSLQKGVPKNSPRIVENREKKRLLQIEKDENRHIKSIWCNNGITATKIKVNKPIPKGFVKGRLWDKHVANSSYKIGKSNNSYKSKLTK